MMAYHFHESKTLMLLRSNWSSVSPKPGGTNSTCTVTADETRTCKLTVDPNHHGQYSASRAISAQQVYARHPKYRYLHDDC
jgi:hypothetical protein